MRADARVYEFDFSTGLHEHEKARETRDRERDREIEKRAREKEGRVCVCWVVDACVCVVCAIVCLHAGARVQQLDTPGYAPKKHSLHLSLCGRAS